MAPEGVLSPSPGHVGVLAQALGHCYSLLEELLALKGSNVLIVLWLGSLCWSQSKGTLFWWWMAFSAPLGLWWGEFVCW